MWRELLRVSGLLLSGYALVNAFFLWMFRFDSTDEYEFALQMDVVFGLVFAVGVALVALPSKGNGTRRWWLGLAFATLTVWVVISGGLAWRHYRQYVIRSTPLEEELPVLVRWL